MSNVSSANAIITLVASNTYPGGIIITDPADDTNPIDIPSVQIADTGMGMNGNLVSWSSANPIPVTLAVVPGSLSDRELSVLFDRNRVQRGKSSANDVITITITYPGNLKTVTLKGGVITDGMPFPGAASSGRQTTATYAFAFEKMSKVLA